MKWRAASQGDLGKPHCGSLHSNKGRGYASKTAGMFICLTVLTWERSPSKLELKLNLELTASFYKIFQP